ncbi:uncharacterized protein si:dkey-256h2.1 [Neolamprologus brichardi]|uniref:uncharacterized protein si:dkey-256h2.1 n=1 Tax=Neolamprologus brichardi TaxID=32507 RepID=UPI0003EBF47C|nr:uncharacterized protein si:dkey-256h2.1 [Neolamprologus brichardi]
MALLRSKSALLWFLIVLAAHIAETGGRPRRQVLLTEGDSTVSLRSRQPPAGPEPGDPADAFKVPTLDGEFSFQPDALRGPLVIHAFTNNSGFLECLWSSESSLKSLVEELPNSTQVLFLSLDDSVVSDVLWMREQVLRAAAHSKKEVLSRLHFSPVPVFALGNWIPRVLYYWSCMGHSCGLSQAAFISEEWKMPVIIKRLDARYDWLMARWGSKSYTVIDAGDGCETFPSVAGAVAWVSEGNCSFFTKVCTLKRWPEGNKSNSLYFGFVSRFDFFADLQTKLQNPAKVVSVFDKVQMQGDKGAVATVDLSIGKFIKTTVELYAVITGHGSDENGCGEFCVTSHHFVINAAYNNTHVFDSAGTALGCAMRVKEGAVPNEHGTWLYGRGGWCDGLQVNPWRVDVTKQLNMSRSESNTVVYFGLFNGRDPNPAQPPGYIIMTSSLVFYK